MCLCQLSSDFSKVTSLLDGVVTPLVPSRATFVHFAILSQKFWGFLIHFSLPVQGFQGREIDMVAIGVELLKERGLA